MSVAIECSISDAQPNCLLLISRFIIFLFLDCNQKVSANVSNPIFQLDLPAQKEIFHKQQPLQPQQRDKTPSSAKPTSFELMIFV
jgi:hypothetical protein